MIKIVLSEANITYKCFMSCAELRNELFWVLFTWDLQNLFIDIHIRRVDIDCLFEIFLCIVIFMTKWTVKLLIYSEFVPLHHTYFDTLTAGNILATIKIDGLFVATVKRRVAQLTSWLWRWFGWLHFNDSFLMIWGYLIS